MRYVFHNRVGKVEHRRHVGRIVKRGDDVIEENVSYSWVVVIGHVAFDFGEEKPDFNEGDEVTMYLERTDVYQ
jgi:hypothetical protein